MKIPNPLTPAHSRTENALARKLEEELVLATARMRLERVGIINNPDAVEREVTHLTALLKKYR